MSFEKVHKWLWRATASWQETKVGCVNVSCWSCQSEGEQVIMQTMAHKNDPFHLGQNLRHLKPHSLNRRRIVQFFTFDAVDVAQAYFFPRNHILSFRNLLNRLLLLFQIGVGSLLEGALAAEEARRFLSSRRRLIILSLLIFLVRLNIWER